MTKVTNPLKPDDPKSSHIGTLQHHVFRHPGANYRDYSIMAVGCMCAARCGGVREFHHHDLVDRADNIVARHKYRELRFSYVFDARRIHGGRVAEQILAVLRAEPAAGKLKYSMNLPNSATAFVLSISAELPREEFCRLWSDALRTDAAVYENLTNDLYSIGTYLSRHKYRYLRFSYVFFLAGFVVATIEQVIRLLRSTHASRPHLRRYFDRTQPRAFAAIAYSGSLDQWYWSPSERLPTAARAFDMGDATLQNARVARLRACSDVDPWLSLIEMPQAPLSLPLARRGWLALVLTVTGIDALAALIDRGIGQRLGQPAASLPGHATRSLQWVGPDGEVHAPDAEAAGKPSRLPEPVRPASIACLTGWSSAQPTCATALASTRAWACLFDAGASARPHLRS